MSTKFDQNDLPFDRPVDIHVIFYAVCDREELTSRDFFKNCIFQSKTCHFRTKMSDFNQKNPYNYDLILTPYFGLRYFETRTVASLDGSNI